MQRFAKVAAGLAGMLGVVVTIIFNNDPEALQRRSCFATRDLLWSCDQLSDPKPLGFSVSPSPAPGAQVDPRPVSSPAAPVVVADMRPAVALSATIDVVPYSNLSTVKVLMRARFTNTTDQPMLIAWNDLLRSMRVAIPAAGEMEPTIASRNPTGVPNCRASASRCWAEYRGNFTKVLPGESVTGPITFALDVENSRVDSVVRSPTYAFTGELIYARPDATLPEVMSISLEDQTLQRVAP